MTFAIVSLAIVSAVHIQEWIHYKVPSTLVEHKPCNIPDACFEVADAIEYHETRRDLLSLLVQNISQYIVPLTSAQTPAVKDSEEKESVDDLEMQGYLKAVVDASTTTGQLKALNSLKDYLLKTYDVIFESATVEERDLYQRSRHILTKKSDNTTLTIPTSSSRAELTLYLIYDPSSMKSSQLLDLQAKLKDEAIKEHSHVDVHIIPVDETESSIFARLPEVARKGSFPKAVLIKSEDDPQHRVKRSKAKTAAKIIRLIEKLVNFIIDKSDLIKHGLVFIERTISGYEAVELNARPGGKSWFWDFFFNDRISAIS